MTGPRVRGVVVGSRKVSITDRESAYEQFWETYFFASVARLLRGDSRRLRQSTTSTASRSAADSTTHLRNNG